MSAAEWIANRRELLDAATEGPWETDGSEITQHWSLPEPWQTVASSEVVCGSYCYGGAGRGIERATDATLMVDARTSLPAALDALEAAIDAGRAHREYGLCTCLGCEMYKRIEAALRGES